MKIKNILLVFILLFINNLIKSELLFQYFDRSNLIDDDTLVFYPTYSSLNNCDFEVKLYVYSEDGLNPREASIDSSWSTTQLSTNGSHVLYQFKILNINNNGTATITATDVDYNQFFKSIKYECRGYSDVTMLIIDNKIVYDWIYGHIAIAKVTGLKKYTTLTSNGNFIYNSDGFYFLLIDYTKAVNYSQPLAFIVNFYDFNINLIVDSYYQVPYYDSNLKVKTYPDNWQSLDVSLIGKRENPIILIETLPQYPQHQPLFLSNLFGIATSMLTTPIYEDSNGIVTYTTSPLPQDSSQGLTNVKLLTQKDGLSNLFYDGSLNILDFPATIYTAFTTINVATNGLVTLSVYPPPKYLLSTIKLSLNSQYLYTQSPYGFCSGSNSNYRFSISASYAVGNRIKVGISNYMGTFPNSFIDSLAPTITNYQCISITSSKYLFKLGISDDLTGAAFISFDGDNSFKRLSQFRTSGTAVSGQYEIPIDFDLDSQFISISIYDSAGNKGYYSHGDFLPTNNIQIIIPFFNFNYSSFNIRNITYLYNNLDVSNQSVGNIMYFDYDGYGDIETLPFTLRFKDMSNLDAGIMFTHEFHSTWNVTANKYQIEFVVPKNSRLGPLSFVLFVYNPSSQMSYMPSEFFPPESQLNISKSTFDGIGPEFSRIEKIAFNDGKFGWSLTIRDPINGFDNGTITVKGSEDNSIYKFDLFPSNVTGGNSTEGVYEIIIDLGSNYCINQDYIITFVKLWDTGAKYTVFELATPTILQSPIPTINPFYLFFNDSSINKFTIQQCTDSQQQDTSPPELLNFAISRDTIDIGSPDRSITFEFEVEDKESGINIKAQGPIVYITGDNLDMVQCISTFKSNTSLTNAIFECTTELPVGLGSINGVVYLSIYGIVNNHQLFNGYDTKMLIDSSLPFLITLSFTSTMGPSLLESGMALSKGGQYFVYGKSLDDVESLTIVDALKGVIGVYKDINIVGSSVIYISNLPSIRDDFIVTVTSKSGIHSNKLLVSPLIFNDYTPSEDSSSSSLSSSSDNSTPLPTNAPQQCLGNPICGGPTHGTCNSLTGCICIYPWKGKSCQDKVIEPVKPDPNPNEPSTGIDIPDDNDDSSSSNPVNNIKYKSLISLYSLREVDINGNTVKNHKFNNMWTFNQLSDLISTYHINVTTGENGFNTTVSATLEWFNQSRTITFAGQDLEMNANSIKYSIDISSYPFSNTINYLQLVMSATLTSTSSDSCSSKDFGDTTSGDNSNYINIQIDNKSLYGRFIKRGIIDNNRTVSLSNEILDSKLNAISTPSTSQSYIGITIPQFKERATIDPDFSVLLNSNSASSKSNSVCKSKGLSGAKIAGIIIGSVAFAAIIIISITYHFMKKRKEQNFKNNIQNKLKQIDNNDL